MKTGACFPVFLFWAILLAQLCFLYFVITLNDIDSSLGIGIRVELMVFYFETFAK